MRQRFFQIAIFLFIFENAAHSQDCSGSPLFKQGKQFVFLDEIASSAKGVPAKTTKKIYMIDSVKEQGGELHASIKEPGQQNERQDGSTKMTATQSHITGIICNGRSISYITTVKSSSVNFVLVNEFPMNMKIGDKFKDQVINLGKSDDKKNNIPGISIYIHRSVVGQEVVTTLAGKWKCFKIAETTTSVIASKNGQSPNSINSPDTNYTWFSADIGIVKMTVGTFHTLTLVGLP
jgi:hypothetical protein